MLVVRAVSAAVLGVVFREVRLQGARQLPHAGPPKLRARSRRASIGDAQL